ncbi:hypothetical protein EMIHUDRAFT_226064 [Emiliania huxleyi CCMP1516]|uniref:Uncharacterized protein n=2 Tax=Emiliania huxleyi TaxID=2903 RepID=A0A0D3KMT5_EMIH1|nr:hypothetical protein EMIHUDRAFT_226064 [Emiliania huxleyi CCMP1516]EOD37070.1 hypothetical protein EMIHUDRAFT_226064 [Emiliania huxleyi CCMP1516]|eukprot:XP_005789499.1 hypothetical protein EMIHUDRAFT_226064 [Emiliania huxleyi CCMP1516]
MPNPLLFVGKGAALTAAARAADKANEGGGAFQRLGEGRGAAIRLAWPAEALHTVPHERRAAAGDADDPFAHGRPITKRARRAAGELRAVQHQERAEAPREAELAAAEERTAEQAALLAPLAATDTTARLAKRRRSALVAAVLHQPIAEPAGRAAQMLAPLGEHLKRQCDEVAKRWDDFQTEMERLDEDGGDADMRSNFANGMRDGYPCQQLTLVFLQYLLTSRIRQSHASRRQGCELVGRGAKTVGVQFNIMRSHVWPILFGEKGFPAGQEAMAYWRPIRDHFSSLVGGGRGSGGVEQLAGVAQAAASALQVAVGANATTAAAAGDAASQAVQLAMRAATAPSLTRQHLGQTGQYILQDALLSEWVEVNEAFVLNAYVTLARQTGCRPGMVVNVGHDSVDQNGAWAHCAPLVWQDLLVGKLEEGFSRWISFGRVG